MEQVAQTQAPRRQNRGFILGSLSFGHGISHLYDQGFPIFMPAITASMGLSIIQVATLLSIRQAESGVVNLGGGVFVDMLKRQWGLILIGCMLRSALAYASLGASPSFAFLVLAVILISIPGSLWHLPATAALSQRFPDRRGFAVAMHGFGSSIGSVLGPLMAGGMLTYMLWRNALFLYAIPALLLAGFVWWSLKDIGREGVQEQQTDMGSRFRHGLGLLKNPVVMALILTATLRGIGLNALFHWTPFYLEDPGTGLRMSHFNAGFHFALLTGMGIASAPFIGAASDRFGRKMVLVPGLTCASLLSFVVVSIGDSLLLIPVFCRPGPLYLRPAPGYSSRSARRGGEGDLGHGRRPYFRAQRNYRWRISLYRDLDHRPPWGIRLHLLLLGGLDRGFRIDRGDDSATAIGVTFRR